MENTPLPPPPSYAPDEEHERPVTPEIEDDLPNVNPDTAIGDLSDNFPDKAADDEDDNSRHHGGKTKKKLDRFVKFVKGSARSSAITVLSADRLKGKTGSPMSKERQGALDKSHFVDGPSVYNCRYNGKKGWLLIVSLASYISRTACICKLMTLFVSFVYHSSEHERNNTLHLLGPPESSARHQAL